MCRRPFLSLLYLLIFPGLAVDSLVPTTSGSKVIRRRSLVENERNGACYYPLLIAAAARRRSQRSISLLSSVTTGSELPCGKIVQHRDVVIVGAGLAGLSAALYLSQIDPSRHVTILEREQPAAQQDSTTKKTAVGSFAAAGMLAPQSERLPKGDYLDLCLASRAMYSQFCSLVEGLAQQSGDEGKVYLREEGHSLDGTDLAPWSVGYVASGGFLAPAFAGDSVATWAPPDESGTATWLDATQVRELEPYLHPDVVGGWWFPEDASVDARRLTNSLRAACVAAGVQIQFGCEIDSLDLGDGVCQGLLLKTGRYIRAKAVLLANGAWMRNLLPVPIQPHKGQSLSLRMPSNQPPLLRRVLFAQDSYIVPKADGRIVVGATVEAGSYDSNVTPAGLLHILTHALQLIPALKDLPVEETWAGLRPTTPDKGPILGKTKWSNLFLAGGYWRNGVLLAPKTGELMALLISGKQPEDLSAFDQQLLKAFAWDRFISKDGGSALAASTRYAASMHPVHSRTSGVGVAAAVGTELGSYSSARSAAQERAKDRKSLFQTGNDTEDSAFEAAAALGKLDSKAYFLGNNKQDNDSNLPAPTTSKTENENTAKPSSTDMVDALTVGTAAEESVSIDSDSVGLEKAYRTIQENMAKRKVKLNESSKQKDERPDPGFRIFHVDPDTGEKRLVPPYTSPKDFLASIEKEKERRPSVAQAQSQQQQQKEAEILETPFKIHGSSPSPVNGEEDSYGESTLDGYQAIQEANSRGTREEELQAMREARRRNRLGLNSIDEDTIGGIRRPDDSI